MDRRYLVILTFAVLLLAALTYRVSFSYFQSVELARASERLSLYRSTVVAELQRFAHLPFVLSRDAMVIAVASGAETHTLNARLRDFTDRAGLDAIYLMNTEGVTTAASNVGEPGSFIGQDYGFRPYFRTALGGTQGRFYGIGATTGLPGYFFADPVVDGRGGLLGVVAIKIDLSGLQNSWRAAGEKVFISNGDGVILLSSNPDWLYRVLSPLSDAQRSRIEDTRQFAGQSFALLDWEPLSADRARLDGQAHLYLSAADLPHEWTLHYFASNDQAVSRSLLSTGSLVLAAGLLMMVFQMQRAARITAALRRSEEEEAALRVANERLAVEIEERNLAEVRLKRTQAELERAGRLAALGQLAASVTHELGQPISAMRNHLTAAEIQNGAGPLTDRLQGLVVRMEGITRQLKFFARKGREEIEDVHLGSAMDAVLDLMAPDIEVKAVTVRKDYPDRCASIRGNKLRIEQVMTNLIRNAMDSVKDVDAPEVHVTVGAEPGEVWFAVADNGPGLEGQTLDALVEPFYTTRESGQGMGLGLAISSAIVDD
ncbi:MAG: cache domain-containing protein, partial [Pseudomonadota bacterium]